jgi:hypothetical protein
LTISYRQSKEESGCETVKEINNEILMYQTEDGATKIEVRYQDENVWLSLNQMAELFQRDKSVISRHIKNVYEEGELEPSSTVANFATVQKEGGRTVERNVDYYNLDVIISVGYRVKSHRGTQFRIWATQRLKEYIIKGFTVNDDLLKQAGGGNYFKELLARIRDIRSSEKIFWRQVLDIYATSIDYDPKADITQTFFKTIQNKMHWAAHGHTAAEIIVDRANGMKENMGMTNFIGSSPTLEEAKVAKNYLNEQELDVLNRIVSMYLDFAELQALNGKPMYMRDWAKKLDEFLRTSERDILIHSGTVSHAKALEKARQEYEIYRERTKDLPTLVEKHFLEAERELKQLAKKVKK